MLDTLSYTQNPDLSWSKTVVHMETVTDTAAEVAALSAQLAAFNDSQAQSPNDEIAAAITNYQAQIDILTAS